MRFLVGLVVGVLLPFVVFGVVVATGAFDMSATRPPGFAERLVGGALADRSTERRAPKRKNPIPLTPEVLKAGLGHYRENCVLCHGAPGVPAGEAAKGLNPPPPDLASADAQEASDGELYWVISRGVRMTGMPAWSPTHSDEEIWHLVAFVRHLRSLSDEERRALARGAEAEPAGEGAAGGEDRRGEALHPAGGHHH